MESERSVLSGLLSQRFGRLERGDARGGVNAGEQTDHAADDWREQGNERIQHRSPDLIGRDAGRQITGIAFGVGRGLRGNVASATP
jgi:hypothetical protein